MNDKVEEPGYVQPEKLELIWGEGFMSPGGPDEVARILGGHAVDARVVRDIGSGLGGADVALLRPGGLLLVSDWLRGPGAETEALVEELVAASGHEFHMVTLPHIAECAALAGFTAIQTEDRGLWYLGEAKAELERLNFATGERFTGDFGHKALDDESDFWQVLVRALEARAMSPGHLRAAKPG